MTPGQPVHIIGETGPVVSVAANNLIAQHQQAKRDALAAIKAFRRGNRVSGLSVRAWELPELRRTLLPMAKRALQDPGSNTPLPEV